MNILVYSGAQSKDGWWKNENLMLNSGNGSTVESVRHALYTFRRLLAPNYAVIPVTGEMILKEPWPASCAALVFPGGADQAYCKTLNGQGNRRIRQYVESGGNYIGFCAGGYYGSKRCEFEVGNKPMEVIGERELAFYPGTTRGCAFAGFVYNSEKGAKAVELQTNKSALTTGSVPNLFKSYYNGGSVFVDAPKYKDQGIEVLASYTEKLSVDPGEGSAAIVYCRIGQGAALLTGPHPEFVFFSTPAEDSWSLTKPRFAPENLEEKPKIPQFSDVIKQLREDQSHRTDFLKACLAKLGLKVSDEQSIPSLSRMYITAASPSAITQLLGQLAPVVTKDEQGEELIKDDNDTFHIVKPSTWSTVDLAKALPTEGLTTDGNLAVAKKSSIPSDQIIDYSTIIKQLLLHDSDYPQPKTTPYFNHASFYANLKQYQSQRQISSPTFGNHLLYGEVVTSTNTLLEKNTRLLRNLPHGFTATATVQVAGRGRGSNVWVSPAGSLMFSTVIRHPMSSLASAPVVFIQYLAAMAVVEGIKSYSGSQYKNTPIKLKWPNDIFALDPAKVAQDSGSDAATKFENYTKIGGILVNSHYNSNDFIAVCGIGLNVANAAPTTSLNQLVSLLPQLSPHHKIRSSPPPPPFALESLLAAILTAFESLYVHFLARGFDAVLEQRYYDHWLHMDQVVTVETEGGARARIKGITSDYGLLIAEELGWEDRPTGKRWELMSDSNSFDFFKGLLKRKQQ